MAFASLNSAKVNLAVAIKNMEKADNGVFFEQELSDSAEMYKKVSEIEKKIEKCLNMHPR